VSRAKADMTSVATAVESYEIDNNDYPGPDIWLISAADGDAYWYTPNSLTTPISYIASDTFSDPFRSEDYSRSGSAGEYYTRYRYINYNEDANEVGFITGALRYGKWRLSSGGPDNTATYNGNITGGFGDYVEPYDPSNGTVSNGDIVRDQSVGIDDREFDTTVGTE